MGSRPSARQNHRSLTYFGSARPLSDETVRPREIFRKILESTLAATVKEPGARRAVLANTPTPRLVRVWCSCFRSFENVATITAEAGMQYVELKKSVSRQVGGPRPSQLTVLFCEISARRQHEYRRRFISEYPNAGMITAWTALDSPRRFVWDQAELGTPASAEVELGRRPPASPPIHSRINMHETQESSTAPPRCVTY
jgi:hypothetical protein